MGDKPECAVRGQIQRGAMCSQVIVGGLLCGYSGACPHQRTKSKHEPARSISTADFCPPPEGSDLRIDHE